MKPWSVILFNHAQRQSQAFHSATGSTGMVYMNRTQNEVKAQGSELPIEQQVFFMDDEPTADKFINWIIGENPGANYVKARSITCSYRELTDRKTGVFNEKGMFPE